MDSVHVYLSTSKSSTVSTQTLRARHRYAFPSNEEQIMKGYPIDGATGSSGGGRVRKLSMVCLHNNAIVARGIVVTILHCGTPERCVSAIYIVSSVGTSLSSWLLPGMGGRTPRVEPKRAQQSIWRHRGGQQAVEARVCRHQWVIT